MNASTNSLIVGVLFSFLTTLIFTRLLMHIAPRIGLVDQPGGRKHHQGNVPLVGGLAIFFSLLLSAFLFWTALPNYRSFFAAIIVLVVAGVLDDLRDISPSKKLMAQLLAALLMTSAAGIQVHELGNILGFGPVLLHAWAIPFTVICVLGLVNAINMADGLDGLAGGVFLSAVGWFAVSAWHVGRFEDFHLLLLVMGAATGFLVFNVRTPWQPVARAFMGDAGSMLLGFVLTWFAVRLSQQPSPHLPPMVAVWFVALPLVDMGTVMLRRLVKGVSPFRADREHLHHVLLLAGYSVSQTGAIMLTVAVLLGLIGFAAWQWQVPESVMFYGFMALFGLYYFAMQRAWRLMKVLRRFHGRRFTTRVH